MGGFLNKIFGEGPTSPQPEVPRPMPAGIRVPGNLNLNNRPVVQNSDGTHSSELSFSRGTSAGEVLVPRVVGGKMLSQDEAWQHYLKTGEHMGIFKTPEEADAYAEDVHNRGTNISMGDGTVYLPSRRKS
jgi:hypothetical protein